MGRDNRKKSVEKTAFLPALLLLSISCVVLGVTGCLSSRSQSKTDANRSVAAVTGSRDQQTVSQPEMERIYQEVKTPNKYGLVLVPPNNDKKMDCPSIFRKGNKWYMVYILYDGRGYETWLASSDDLLHWKSKGALLAFSDSASGDWDTNQKAGYIALGSMKWGGDYEWLPYQGKHWMSYFGGKGTGYEKGLLSIGMAWTKKDPAKVHPWKRLNHPVLMSTDRDVRWWENHTQYKSSVIWDREKHTGHPFVMYYNANGDSLSKTRGAERIGMAVSDDMVHWKRYLKDPVLDHFQGITGDPVIQKIGNLYVMFYFGAFWKNSDGAFNKFACSYDLIHWTDWKGKNLIEPSEPYDSLFAHKSFVLKYKGVVYHYYCAVNKAGQRGIAVATSGDLGRSDLHFVAPPAKKKKK